MNAIESASNRRYWAALAFASVLVLLGYLVASTTPRAAAQAEDCANAAIRDAQGSTFLPDCRAYEQVSPTVKNSHHALPEGGVIVLPNEDSIIYGGVPGASFPGSVGTIANRYLSTRAADGTSWGLEPITPQPVTPSPGANNGSTGLAAISPDGRRQLFTTPERFDPGDVHYNPANPNLNNDVYRREADGSLTWISRGSDGTGSNLPQMATPDLEQVVFRSAMSLDPQRPVSVAQCTGFFNDAPRCLYVSDGGTPELLSVLPDNETPTATMPGGTVHDNASSSTAFNALSSDGRYAVFYGSLSPSGQPPVTQLYLRDRQGVTPGSSLPGETTLISKFGPDSASPGDPGEGVVRYRGARWGDSPGEVTVYFSSWDDLLGGHPGGGLYAYDSLTDSLSFLAPAAYRQTYPGSETEECSLAYPNRCSDLIQISDDGSRIYFASAHVLDGPSGTEPDQNEQGRTNLYELDVASGESTFIAKLAGSLSQERTLPTGEAGSVQQDIGLHPIDGSGAGQLSRLSSGDGRYLAFTAKSDLTGFGNPIGQIERVYRYDAVDDELICVSCGVQSGGISLMGMANAPGFARLRSDPLGGGLGAAYSDLYQPRWISDDGQYIFFNSRAAIVPEDTNGLPDPYVWHDGEASLLTPPNSPDASVLLSADPSGNTAYIATRSRLVSQDTDQLYDVYAVKADGGIPSQMAKADPACQGDGCQGNPAGRPATEQAASGSYDGAGNPSADRPPRSCAAPERRARNLTAQAKRLKRQARRASGARSQRIARKAKRTTRQAKQARQRARTCQREARS